MAFHDERKIVDEIMKLSEPLDLDQRRSLARRLTQVRPAERSAMMRENVNVRRNRWREKQTKKAARAA